MYSDNRCGHRLQLLSVYKGVLCGDCSWYCTHNSYGCVALETVSWWEICIIQITHIWPVMYTTWNNFHISWNDICKMNGQNVLIYIYIERERGRGRERERFWSENRMKKRFHTTPLADNLFDETAELSCNAQICDLNDWSESKSWEMEFHNISSMNHEWIVKLLPAPSMADDKKSSIPPPPGNANWHYLFNTPALTFLGLLYVANAAVSIPSVILYVHNQTSDVLNTELSWIPV